MYILNSDFEFKYLIRQIKFVQMLMSVVITNSTLKSTQSLVSV